MARAGAEPTSMMRTEVLVPLFPLQHRCKVCRLAQSHPEISDELTRRLLEARKRKDIVSWLKRNGISINEKGLSRHYQRHMLPYFREALEVERRLRAEMNVLDGDTSASIASALARTLAMRGLTAASAIDMDALAENADPDTLRELANLAKVVAQIDSMAADRRLKEKLVQIRQIELELKSGNLEKAAVRWLMLRLQDRPAVARQVIEMLDLPMPIAAMKALPQPSNGKTKRKRSSGRRQGGTRKKR